MLRLYDCFGITGARLRRRNQAGGNRRALNSRRIRPRTRLRRVNAQHGQVERGMFGHRQIRNVDQIDMQHIATIFRRQSHVHEIANHKNRQQMEQQYAEQQQSRTATIAVVTPPANLAQQGVARVIETRHVGDLANRIKRHWQRIGAFQRRRVLLHHGPSHQGKTAKDSRPSVLER
ncbi:MAG: hypothetical protein ABI411_06395 [Tahibacter sp.]